MIHPLIQEKLKKLNGGFGFYKNGAVDWESLELFFSQALTDVMEATKRETTDFILKNGLDYERGVVHGMRKGAKEERERILAALPLSAPTKNGIANDLNDGYNAAIVAIRSLITSPSKDTV